MPEWDYKFIWNILSSAAIGILGFLGSAWAYNKWYMNMTYVRKDEFDKKLDDKLDPIIKEIEKIKQLPIDFAIFKEKYNGDTKLHEQKLNYQEKNQHLMIDKLNKITDKLENDN